MQSSPPRPPDPAAGVLDAIVPTNPLAAVACWVGIFSMLTCLLGVVLGPIAVATGVISLKKGAIIQQSAYGRGSSLARSYIGIVTGAIGTLIGIGVVVMMLLKQH